MRQCSRGMQVCDCGARACRRYQVYLTGSSYDTLLGVYLPTGSGFGDLLGKNDDCIEFTSCVTVLVPPGATQLRAQVRGWRVVEGSFLWAASGDARHVAHGMRA
jgi:hypothetical protein